MSKKGIHIKPPPKEQGLFRVVYVIDVGAENFLDAAKSVYQMMSDPDSMLPVVEVIDNEGNRIKFDLSKRKEKHAD